MSSTKEFTGKVVLITGASSGIGETTAVHFAKAGANVSLVGRNVENLEKTAQQCVQEGTQKKPLIIKADLSKEDEVSTVVEKTIQHFGKLDILVNNAGIAEICSFEDATMEHFDKIMNTNVRAVYQLTKLAVPFLIETKGCIVNVSSLAGIRAYANMTSYCMSKIALDHFARCLSLELAPKGVRVNNVNPGVVVTDIFARGGMTDEEVEAFLQHHRDINPLGRVGTTTDVANMILFLASEKASFTTGAIVPIDGGRGNMCPR